MKIENKLLRNDEKAVFALRSLYEKYGYAQFKMSKFEEYDLYVRNKDFLVSDNIITFTDTNGKLMALKPDVTLSIIKSSDEANGCTQKEYYNENVYRTPKSSASFKEIMQVGLECIGNIDTYSIFEVLSLAAESLKIISEDFVLDISHMGVITGLMKDLSLDSESEKEIMKCMGEKNAHQILEICERNGVCKEKAQKIAELTCVYGSIKDVTKKLEDLIGDDGKDALNELIMVANLLETCGYGDRLHIDFSVINDMNYYNGIVFKGFINSIPEGILSGGQYDKLMKKMNKKSRAIGFAVYPDFLERLGDNKKDYDIDTLILYDDKSDIGVLTNTIKMMTEGGKSASAQREIPPKLKYKQLLRLNARGLEIVETNA